MVVEFGSLDVYLAVSRSSLSLAHGSSSPFIEDLGLKLQLMKREGLGNCLPFPGLLGSPSLLDLHILPPNNYEAQFLRLNVLTPTTVDFLRGPSRHSFPATLVPTPGWPSKPFSLNTPFYESKRKVFYP